MGDSMGRGLLPSIQNEHLHTPRSQKVADSLVQRTSAEEL